MPEMELIFYGNNGRQVAIDRRLYDFFGQKSALKRVRNSLPVFQRLLENKSFYGIFLIFKAGLMSLAGKGDDCLTVSEYTAFWRCLVGFPMSKVECKTESLSMIFDTEGLITASILSLFFEIVRANQYNLSQKTAKGKIMVDAGANLGVFSIYAAKLGAKRVYAFEPVAETYIQLKKNIALNGLGNIITPINKALGNKKGKSEISYGFCGDGGASLEFLNKGIKKQIVQVDTIDNFIGNKDNVDFIKMDVEGFEEKVLLGGAKTIKRCKPYLAMSAYHKPDDGVVLVRAVKNIRKDYTCRLEQRCELDLYCE